MTRAKRFALQLVLLPVLALTAAYNPSAFQAIVAIAIILIWPVAVAVALILVWLSRAAERLDGPAPNSMVETTDNAVTHALQYTGLTAAVVVAYWLDQDGSTWFIYLAWSIVLGGFPPASWLHILRRVWWPMIERRSNDARR